MSATAFNPLASTPLLAAWISARALGVGLWVGLGLLTLLLAALMRTRWGQARPLTKCVALSLLVHLLLFGYACGTKLIFQPPPLPPEETFQLTFVAATDEPSEPASGQEQSDALAPWERLAAAETPPPAAEDLERAVLAAEQPAPLDSWVAPPPLEAPPPEDRLAAATPTPGVAAPPETADALRAATPAKATAELERPAPPRRQAAPDAPAAEPSGPPLERLAPEPPAAEPLAPVPPFPFAQMAEASRRRLQRLAEAPLAELGDAAADLDDAPQAADNRGQPTDPHPVAAAGGAHPAEESGAADRPDSQPAPTPSPTARPTRLGDGQPLPPVYAGRLPARREPLLRRRGGGPQTEAAVAAALAWLAANQSPDGRWDPDAFGAGQETRVLGHDRRGAGADADTGITGLALLALLGAGHTHLEGPYRQVVQHGLEFLLRQQREDGNLAGRARLFASMYCHGMAALALAEAYAMTGDYRLKRHVERAVQYTIDAQHRGSGGWRYQPGDRGDTSQFGWQVMALHSAAWSGWPIPPQTRQGMLRFLRSVSSGPRGGLASYRPGEQPSPTMTAEALLCRLLLQTPGQEAAIEEAADYLLQSPPTGDPLNLYYCYYGSLALAQLDDERWAAWNQALLEALLPRQRTDGSLAGSWDPDTVWGAYGGRVYSTALAALCLEVYYRYQPVGRRPPAPGQGKPRPERTAARPAAAAPGKAHRRGPDPFDRDLQPIRMR